jgi:hypothetical protein
MLLKKRKYNHRQKGVASARAALARDVLRFLFVGDPWKTRRGD